MEKFFFVPFHTVNSISKLNMAGWMKDLYPSETATNEKMSQVVGCRPWWCGCVVKQTNALDTPDCARELTPDLQALFCITQRGFIEDNLFNYPKKSRHKGKVAGVLALSFDEKVMCAWWDLVSDWFFHSITNFKTISISVKLTAIICWTEVSTKLGKQIAV